MRKILVLVDTIGPNRRRLVRFLNRNSKGEYKAILRKFSDLFFEIKTRKVKIKAGEDDLANFDLVFIRRAGKFIRSIGGIVKYLDYKKVEFIDPAYREVGISLDKASSAIRLAIKGTPVPDTVFCYKESVSKNKERIVAALGFPIIAKAVFSQKNRDIYILRNLQDFDRLQKKSKKDFIFQKFIDIDIEYRLLIMGGEVRVLEQKYERNYENLKVGFKKLSGLSIFLDLKTASPEINNVALKAAKILGLDIAGVDLAVEKRTDKNYVIEVNKGPGIISDGRSSPEIKALSDFLIQKIRRVSDG